MEIVYFTFVKTFFLLRFAFALFRPLGTGAFQLTFPWRRKKKKRNHRVFLIFGLHFHLLCYTRYIILNPFHAELIDVFPQFSSSFNRCQHTHTIPFAPE